uniref:Uncharacterized protein n=1 Tax=Nelumbo nucifera TaxID=4432 RepID=A0A822XUE9_NELNU|nr:TPA_asm: hypothetical protein HUJ06_025463 [Nelumbo nucifera]
MSSGYEAVFVDQYSTISVAFAVQHIPRSAVFSEFFVVLMAVRIARNLNFLSLVILSNSIEVVNVLLGRSPGAKLELRTLVRDIRTKTGNDGFIVFIFPEPKIEQPISWQVANAPSLGCGPLWVVPFLLKLLSSELCNSNLIVVAPLI